MKTQARRLGAIVVAVATALTPTAAFAATDTGWTKNKSLYEIHTWAGKTEWGLTDGDPASALLFQPRSVAALPDGGLLVADTANQVLRKLTSKQVSTYAGLVVDVDEAGMPIGYYHDDAKDKALFSKPAGLAVDKQGNIYVADSGNHAIRKIAANGTVTTLAGSGLLGRKDGKGKEASFQEPSDVAVDANGNVYVADTLNHTIRKIAADGTVTTLTAPSARVVEDIPGAVDNAGDFKDGPIASAKFNEPSGLALDAKGNLYISDRGNQRIRYIDFQSGQVTTVAGGGALSASEPYVAGDYADGAGTIARFNSPEGIAIAPDGTLIVADGLNHAVRLIRAGKVSTLAGVAGEFGKLDGVTGSAQFNHPTDVAVLSDGRLAIADEYGNKIRVLQKYTRPSIPASVKIPVLLNGKLVATDLPAVERSGAVFLPLRSAGNALGFTVSYDAKQGAAILKKGDKTYAVKKGSKSVSVTQGSTKTTLTLNGTPYESGNRLFIPVRFFATESGLDVVWDGSAKTVVIRSKTY